MKHEYHKAADIFPMMTAEERADLEHDIQENGLQEAIALFDDKILDGRNRYEASLAVGAKPRFVEVYPDDPVAYVLSHNLHRRHLTISQRALVAARSREYYDAQAKQRQKESGGDRKSQKAKGKSVVDTVPQPIKAKSRDQAGKAVGVSGMTVDRATRVLRKGSKELINAIDKGEVTVSTAVAVLEKAPEEQLPEARIKSTRKPPRKNLKRLTDTRKKQILAAVDKALKLMAVQLATHIDLMGVRHELNTIRNIVKELTPQNGTNDDGDEQ